MILTFLTLNLGFALDLSGFLTNLEEAKSLSRQRQREAASVAFERAFREAEKIGSDSVAMALVLDAMAYEDQQNGQLQTAIRGYLRAVDIFARKLPPASHNTVISAVSLSSAHLESGEISRAEAILRRFLALDSHLNSNDWAILMVELGSVRAQQGELEDGKRLFEEGLVALQNPSQKLTDHYDGRIVVILTNLAGIYAQVGRVREAVELTSRARSRLASMEQPDLMLVIKTYANSAVIAAAAQNWKEAQQYFDKSIAECRRSYGEDHRYWERF